MFSKKDIEEMANHIMDMKPVERGIVFVQYCEGVGAAVKRSNNDLGLCDNPKCDNCRNLEDLFKEEINKQINNINKNG